MTSRERVRRAIRFENPDCMPVECNGSASGLYEHGEKLRDLWRQYPSDFCDPNDQPDPKPGPEDFDADGRYHKIRVDEWGIEWEHFIYGAWGIPRKRPLDDIGKLDTLTTPAPPPMSGPSFEARRRDAEQRREKYWQWGGAGNVFEIMHSLRRFEDVLMDIHDDTPEINRVADIIFGLRRSEVALSLAIDSDGVGFGDDYGTQESLIISMDDWKTFFAPRYEAAMAPIREANKPIHMHSCGAILPLMPELAKLGVTSIWPQLPLYDLNELRAVTRDLGIAVALHVDRGHTMTYGSPDDVRREVDRVAKAFVRPEGGAWWYIEIDNGFPWENVVALYEAISENR
jgi:hypothetical protein